MNLYALHGFLGSPEDWEMHAALPGLLIKEDLFAGCESSSLTGWAANFNQRVHEHSGHESNILMGYSLGGRLALHALLDQPRLWNRAIIISTHPGLVDEKAKNERLKTDEHWASRLASQNWGEWIDDWNGQAVFHYDPPMKMLPQTKDRCKRMALALQNWSLGRQNDLSIEIADLDLPILWIVGRQDEKFMNETARLKFKHPESRVVAVEGAGHRVPWTQKEKLLELITQFMHFPEGNK